MKNYTVTMKNYKRRDTYRSTEGGSGMEGKTSGTTLCFTSRDEDFKLSLAARTRERAETGRPTTRRVRGGVSAVAYLATLCILRYPRQEHEQFTA